MRELNIGIKQHTTVFAVDEPEFGANHEYEVRETTTPDEEWAFSPMKINFQKGPIKEHGRNGIHNEDLIAIVIDRLEGFQTTDFACMANGLAIEHLRGALNCLNNRTKARRDRGVEGTSKI